MEDLTDNRNTRRFYDRICRVYDVLADPSEHAMRECGIEALALTAGERALDVGFGTGHGLLTIARARLVSAPHHRVSIVLGDAGALCFAACRFDAVFFSFMLERFGPGIPLVLSEARRVLRPDGRIGIVAMEGAMAAGAASSVNEWLHERFPDAVDCVPIDVVGVTAAAGFQVEVV